jgi:hypothetical protein
MRLAAEFTARRCTGEPLPVDEDAESESDSDSEEPPPKAPRLVSAPSPAAGRSQPAALASPQTGAELGVADSAAAQHADPCSPGPRAADHADGAAVAADGADPPAAGAGDRGAVTRAVNLPSGQPFMFADLRQFACRVDDSIGEPGSAPVSQAKQEQALWLRTPASTSSS